MSVFRGFFIRQAVGSLRSACVHCSSLLELGRQPPQIREVFTSSLQPLSLPFCSFPYWPGLGDTSLQPLLHMIQCVYIRESSNSVPTRQMDSEVRQVMGRSQTHSLQVSDPWIRGDGGLNGLPVHPSSCVRWALLLHCFLAISHSKVFAGWQTSCFPLTTPQERQSVQDLLFMGASKPLF